MGSVIKIGWIGWSMKFAELTGLRVLVAMAKASLGRFRSPNGFPINRRVDDEFLGGACLGYPGAFLPPMIC
jgi:hypothetical protein